MHEPGATGHAPDVGRSPDDVDDTGGVMPLRGIVNRVMGAGRTAGGAGTRRGAGGGLGTGSGMGTGAAGTRGAGGRRSQDEAIGRGVRSVLSRFRR